MSSADQKFFTEVSPCDGSFVLTGQAVHRLDGCITRHFDIGLGA
jgi:hypothetical protein